MKLKVYGDKQHYRPPHRRLLNDILKAHWNDRSEAARRSVYGTRFTHFEVVSNITEADLCLLPMKWNYYVEHDEVRQAEEAAIEACDAGKRLIVFSEGDYPADIPMEDVYLLEASGYRSRASVPTSGLPAFFKDFTSNYFREGLTYRKRRDRPMVGFCGQAAVSTAGASVRKLVNWLRWGSFKGGLGRWEPPLVEHTMLRRNALQHLENYPALETNFVVRRRYRAGVGSKKQRKNPFEATRLEFVRNIVNSDYTLCVRGTGNYSRRFYETLCLGRIPVFIDTDCVLPYKDAINWRDYCVFLDGSEIEYVGEKVADFHANLSNGDFVDLQRACRKLWENRLSPDGFYAHFHEHFPQLQTQ